MQRPVRISEGKVLENWAISESSSVRRWKDITKILPKETITKVKNRQLSKLSKQDNYALKRMIIEFRLPLLKGLLRIKPTWWKGSIDVKDLEKLRIINWPPFVNLTGSQNFADLIDSFEDGHFPPNHKEFEANLKRIRRNLQIKEMVGVPIAVAENKNPPYFLVEGFTRYAAILMNFRNKKLTDEKIPLILGVSVNIKHWHLWDDVANINLFHT